VQEARGRRHEDGEDQAWQDGFACHLDDVAERRRRSVDGVGKIAVRVAVAAALGVEGGAGGHLPPVDVDRRRLVSNKVSIRGSRRRNERSGSPIPAVTHPASRN